MGLKIGDLAKATSTTVETIRYYEKAGLLPHPERTESNYRSYSREHLNRLNFVRHARGLGFELADIRSLLSLSDNPAADCAEADRIATGHLKSVEAKIAQLRLLKDELRRMIGLCRGGQISNCRIMEVLADHTLCASEHAP
jgi:Cu(I)-responsive transcriptional regulator